LIEAPESDVKLVVVAGIARFGQPTLVNELGAQGVEKLRVAGQERLLNLRQTAADPIVAGVTLAEAAKRLQKALGELKARAKRAESAPLHRMMPVADDQPVRWALALDELQPTGVELRPRVPAAGEDDPGGPALTTAAPSKPLSELLGPLPLDPLTVIDDANWLRTIDDEQNLPGWVAPGLRELYRQ
jgi:5-methylthioadenosine/S-adenosylhomocysteine deaminase